jgi:alpha-D-ribose 1-methylphosphonate 5-triphosphate synthase subunit PhnG
MDLSSCIGKRRRRKGPIGMDEDSEARRAWMGLLARAPAARLAALWAEAGEAPAHDWLRPPETGAAMVRGRAGGEGAPFNLGEMTVTRCALRLDCGAVGHAYVQGTEAAGRIRATVLDPLEAGMAAAAQARARKAAATKVDFFTLARGED